MPEQRASLARNAEIVAEALAWPNGALSDISRPVVPSRQQLPYAMPSAYATQILYSWISIHITYDAEFEVLYRT